MKTIIKYELVINEALRSALNYNTPDEQINEFIRFFGRHIGSDRIYIFEDCKEKHGTDNTYEWCAQGVVPEIGRLQNVNMDIIKWWYGYVFQERKNAMKLIYTVRMILRKMNRLINVSCGNRPYN